ncbi:MAG: HD domain-containing protein [Clostridia bacterium]|nr:HD domain-containing protein [Clostridia bacterium]
MHGYVVMENVMEREVISCMREMMKNSRLSDMIDHNQHGDTPCLAHTIAVVYCALDIANKLKIKINKKELIRGGILHDYFLYDWHDGKPERRIHGFTHPGKALRNAEEDFDLTDRERDIIKKHMFPLTIAPPRYREAWLICIADKICAVKEATVRGVYPEIKRMIYRNEQKWRKNEQ